MLFFYFTIWISCLCVSPFSSSVLMVIILKHFNFSFFRPQDISSKKTVPQTAYENSKLSFFAWLLKLGLLVFSIALAYVSTGLMDINFYLPALTITFTGCFACSLKCTFNTKTPILSIDLLQISFCNIMSVLFLS